MPSDTEIEALAREILTEAIAKISEWNDPPFEDLMESEDGELVPVYGSTSSDGLGSFYYEYVPVEAVKTIIIECTRIFEGFKIRVIDTLSGEFRDGQLSEGHTPESRDDSIRSMATVATVHLIASLRNRLCELLEEAVKDCSLMAESSLAAVIASRLHEASFEDITADIREDIDVAAQRVADSKRSLLRGSIKGIPHILVETKRGAPPKSQATRERERDEYSVKVDNAYRKLRGDAGAMPLKKDVAKELGTGGVNWQTGGDSRLNAFNNKLKNMGIDYDAIVAKVEAELHK